MTKTMRSVPTILQQIRAVILEKHYATIDDFSSSVAYAAPETHQFWLGEIGTFINAIVSYPPIEEWEFNVVSALMNQPVEKIKEQFKNK